MCAQMHGKRTCKLKENFIYKMRLHKLTDCANIATLIKVYKNVIILKYRTFQDKHKLTF